MSADFPLISVVIPCFNAEMYLEEAIQSIIKQTYTNLEIIVMNDGSTDGTREILNKYAANDKRIKIYENPGNRGLIYTLNKGVQVAKGEYIARMDADDIAAPERIEETLKIFYKMPDVSVVSSPAILINMKGKIIQRPIPKAFNYIPLKFVSFFSTPVIHPSIIAKTEVLKQNPYHEDYIHSEDYELFSRLLFLGYKIYHGSNPYYYIRVNQASVSNKFETIQISTHTRISREHIERYFNVSLDFFLHKVIINRINFDVTLTLAKEAFEKLELFKQIFIEREKCTDSEIEEINQYLIEQKIDIILQSIKYARWLNKVGLFGFLFKNMKLFTNPRGSYYLFSKIGSKTKFI